MTSTPNSLDIGDPLLKQLSRIKVSPVLIGMAYSVLEASIRARVAWYTGHLYTVGTVTGFFDDPSVYTHLIANAAIFAYYTWMPRGIATVFKGLYGNRVIGDPIPNSKYEREESPYTSFLEEMETLFGRWWWSASSLATASGVVSILFPPRFLALTQSVWWAADIPNQIFASLEVLIGLYCVMLLLIYSVLSIYWLHRLFNNFKIDVRPLHPDRAGGLSPLGNFTLTLSYIIALIGIMLVITPITRNYVTTGTLQFWWTPEILVGLVAYAIAAPTVFFAPLSVAHKSMEDAKHQLLLQIARRFEKECSRIQEVLDKDILSFENSSKTLKELQTLHDTISKFPVWPFNVANITRFGTSYVSPIALAIIVGLIGKMI